MAKKVTINVQFTEGEILALMNTTGFVFAKGFQGDPAATHLVTDVDLQAAFNKIVGASRDHILNTGSIGKPFPKKKT